MSTGMQSFSGPGSKVKGLKGTGYTGINLPTQDLNQAGLTNNLYSSLMGNPGFQQGLSRLSGLAGGDQSQFQQMEAPALRQFNALQGSLGSRFSGMGGSGSRNSSGFQNTMGEAGADLSERLAGNRMSMQQQALSQLMGLSDSLLGRKTYETALMPKQMPFWQQMLIGLAGSAGQAGSQAANLGIAGAMGAF